MAKAPKAETAEQAQSKPKVATAPRKLVPLEKRLSKQRKEEAKRRRQLDAVQSCSERAKAQLAAVIASVNEWAQNPEAGSWGK
jgi:hypothetical protein